MPTPRTVTETLIADVAFGCLASMKINFRKHVNNSMLFCKGLNMYALIFQLKDLAFLFNMQFTSGILHEQKHMKSGNRYCLNVHSKIY